ncbi:hypothetical protein J132_03665 [Termitomyces sp. J132]|nr:hypothetical protein J132_03665 [Termitomyces sp. J132]
MTEFLLLVLSPDMDGCLLKAGLSGACSAGRAVLGSSASGSGAVSQFGEDEAVAAVRRREDSEGSRLAQEDEDEDEEGGGAGNV